MYERTLTADRSGPVHLEIDMHDGDIRVQVGGHRAQVTLSTPESRRSTSGRVIDGAALQPGIGTLSLKVPAAEAPQVFHSGGDQVITNSRIGGTVIQVARASGGTIYSAGRNISVNIGGDNSGIVSTGDGETVVQTAAAGESDVAAEVVLPAGSALTIRSPLAHVVTEGELEAVAVESKYGSLSVDTCKRLIVHTKRGAVTAKAADKVHVRAGSRPVSIGRTGEADIRTTDGAIDIQDFGGWAKLRTDSGSITVHAKEPGDLDADSYDGRIEITAAPDLEAHDLRVKAYSSSGEVRLPHPSEPQRRTRSPRSPS